MAGLIVCAALTAPELGQWLYLAAAIIGGFATLPAHAAKGLFLRGDITAGVMAATATIRRRLPWVNMPPQRWLCS